MVGFATKIFSSVADCALAAYIINVCELKELCFHANAIDNVAYRTLYLNSAAQLIHKGVHNLAQRMNDYSVLNLSLQYRPEIY
jgi:hypothetical protein